MRVLVIGAGSRGDFQPMLALSLALQRAGHQPTLLGSPGFRGEAETFGVPFGPSGIDVEAFIADARKEMRSPIGLLRTLNGVIQREFNEQVLRMEPHVRSADLVVAAGATMAAHLLAEGCGVPYRYIGYTPQILLSAHHSVMMLPGSGWPRWINRASWSASRWFYERLLRDDYNRVRHTMGLGAEPQIFNAIFPTPKAALACDPEIFAAPPDLAHVPQFGAFELPDERPLSRETIDFIEAGPAPVYLGFGSMPDDDPGRTTRTIVEAVKRAGVRLLLSAGWSKLGEGALGPQIHVLGPVSHRLLFPRVAATVHHGGAGTTAASARAGVPQLLVPHGFDQFTFARQIRLNGLGPKPFPKQKLTAERLAEGFRILLEDKDLRERARVAGEAIRRRDPLTAAVRWLETSVRPPAPLGTA